MTSTGRDDRRPRLTRLRLVGGKGGVGKTTCAAAMGVAAASDGLRTLLVSTDPAPSLGDALEVPLTSSPRRAAPRTLPLDALELDAPRAFRRWLSSRRAVLETIAARGTWLDHEDVERLLRLSLPGIDEVAALLEILSVVRSGKYDLVVVDTAPTGHTLRLLSMPEVLHRVAGVFDAMQAKHRAVVYALRGSWQQDAGDDLIDQLAHAAADLRNLLRDRERVQLYWVTLPEPMAVNETVDALTALRRDGIEIETLVINRVTGPPPSPCSRCSARRGFEARALKDLERRVSEPPLRFVEGRGRELRGLAQLKRIGREIENAAALPMVPGQARWRAWESTATPPAITSLVIPSTRLVMFGGKGGVGKTTCAAAASMVLAAASPKRRILLVSADPAHSVGDALALALDDTPRTIAGAPPNLRVRELDAAARFASLRERYSDAIEQLFSRIAGTAIDPGHDRRVLAELIELAPPGIDELVAVADVADFVEDGGAFDLVVMDLAPSGHALRLLETPLLVQDWVRVLMRILLKYQSVSGIGDLGAMLLGMSKSLGRLRDLLKDSARCRFVAVARAAALPRAETRRLLTRLTRLRVPVAALVVNAVGRGRCARCRTEVADERRLLMLLAQDAAEAGVPLLVTPEQVPPPSGQRALRQWCGAWRTEVPNLGRPV